MPHMPAASKQPTAPPIREMTADSPNTIPKMAPGVNPSVFRMPTSRMRSRTDIEMVLPETSRMVNVTAPQDRHDKQTQVSKERKEAELESLFRFALGLKGRSLKLTIHGLGHARDVGRAVGLGFVGLHGFGDVLVTKLAVTPGFDFGSYLERSRQGAANSPANSPMYNVKLDIAVRTAPELQMKTAVARLSGDADLRLRGSLARPSVLGRADILEGDATFNGIKFRLERGDITFANPVAIEPQVNLPATTHVRNYDLDVTVTGTPDRLNVNYRSEPPLPKSDIIALLALGRTGQNRNSCSSNRDKPCSPTRPPT